jgi:hypothetical protein
MRILAFILALLLLGGAVEAGQMWLSVLVGLTAAGAMRLSFSDAFVVRPRLDVRLASLVLAVLLLAGAVEASRDWLIAMSAVAGVAAFAPGIVSLEPGRRDRGRRWSGGRRTHSRRYAGQRAAWDGEDFA